MRLTSPPSARSNAGVARGASRALVWLNAAVWGAAVLLVVAYHGELAWSLRAFPAQLGRGELPQGRQWELYAEAARAWHPGGDAAEAESLLERSLAIEPNVEPMLLLAQVLADQGEKERALGWLRRVIEFDPAQLEAYLGAAELLGDEGHEEERAAVLREGLTWFEHAVVLWVPRPDGTVGAEYNAKARAVYERLERGRRILEANVRLLDSEPPRPGAPAAP